MKHLSFVALAALIGLTSLGNFSLAAVQRPLPPKPMKILERESAVTGGVAGNGFSLKDLHWSKLETNKERIIIDLGDINGAPVRGLPAYYHAELSEKPRRLILDFAQTPNVFIDEKALAKKLKASGRVTGTSMILDPTDQTLSLILDLKKGVKAQIFQVSGKKETSRVVVDLQ